MILLPAVLFVALHAFADPPAEPSPENPPEEAPAAPAFRPGRVVVSSAAAFAPGAADPGGKAGGRVMHDRKLLLSTSLNSLKDRDENIRAKAAEDLGRFRPKAVEAVPELIKALDDPAPAVRYRAAESLQRIGTKKAREAVWDYRKRLGREKSW